MTPHEESPLARTLADWRAAIGPEHVIVDAATLARAGEATFATAARVLAIVRPGSRDEVRVCLQIATAHGVPLHPIGRGKNWGYGSGAPARDAVVLELARLEAIVACDPELGTLTLEAGVTFRQAAAYLEVHAPELLLPATGGPADASVVATTLERGDGAGPLADLFTHACALEVVLPTGEVLHTGLAQFPGARAARAHKWGLGPSLDGLFSQSHFGIVTELTLWLARRTPHARLLFGAVAEDASLGALVDGTRRLMQEGTLRSPAWLWNDVKALGVVQQFPFDRAAPPLPEAYLETFRRTAPFGAWHVSCALYSADAAIAEAEERRVAHVLAPVCTHWQAAPVPAGSGPDGVPSDSNLPMAYWRKRTPATPPFDVHRDRCGLFWSAHAVPFRAGDAQRATRLARERFGTFEPNLALIGISPRVLYLIALLVFDRDVAGEDARAVAAFRAISEALEGAGYLPFRLGIQTPHLPEGQEPASARFLEAIAAHVDPAGVLGPGRYSPGRAGGSP